MKAANDKSQPTAIEYEPPAHNQYIRRRRIIAFSLIAASAIGFTLLWATNNLNQFKLDSTSWVSMVLETVMGVGLLCLAIPGFNMLTEKPRNKNEKEE